MDRPRITIRPARTEDILLLTKLGQQTFFETFEAFNTKENMTLYAEEHFQPDVWEEEMEDVGSVFFLALDREMPVGFTKLRIGHEPAEWQAMSCLEVERLYVVRDFLSKKVGAALMTHNIDYGVDNGYDALWLGVWENNIRAIRFYERWGFVGCGTQTFWLGNDPQQDVIMQKKIR
jgi:diamine N-acetyltransferase